MAETESERQMLLLAKQVKVDEHPGILRQHALDLAALVEEMLGQQDGPVLRCGWCGRNLQTEYGRALHVVFGDGSMRCYDVDGLSPTYVVCRALLDCEERSRSIARLVAGGTDERFPGAQVYGDGGKDNG